MISNLAARLARLRGTLAVGSPPAASATTSTDVPAAPPLEPAGVAMAPPAGGGLWAVHRALPRAFVQGKYPVARALHTTDEHFKCLAPGDAMVGVAPARLLFLDTETTGLSSGAGTVAFLIGVASFVDGALQLTQWLLPRLGDERPMLEHLRRKWEASDAVVTYNGKSFDWPLLRNRFVLNRVPLPTPKPHLDLLHGARRLLRAPHGASAGVRAPSYRLIQVEHAWLHFFREGDVGGAAVPELYAAYLRGHGTHVLEPVLEHNRHDLVSLVALLGLLSQCLADAQAPVAGVDPLAVAHAWARGRNAPQAYAFAQAALARDVREVRPAACLLLARLHAQGRCWPQAAAALHRGLREVTEGDVSCAQQAALHLALAKIYEHRLHDVVRAGAHARYTALAEPPDVHRRRLARLAQKLDAAAGGCSGRTQRAPRERQTDMRADHLRRPQPPQPGAGEAIR